MTVVRVCSLVCGTWIPGWMLEMSTHTTVQRLWLMIGPPQRHIAIEQRILSSISVAGCGMHEADFCCFEQSHVSCAPQVSLKDDQCVCSLPDYSCTCRLADSKMRAPNSIDSNTYD